MASGGSGDEAKVGMNGYASATAINR